MTLVVNFLKPKKSPVLKTGLFLFILTGIISCTSLDTPTTNEYTEHYSGEAQGTTFSIIAIDSLERDLSYSIDSVFHLMDYTFSAYVDTSIVTNINENRAYQLNEHFIHLFNLSRKLSLQTNGAFDLTVGQLARAWGFGPSQEKSVTPKIDSLLKLTGYDKVTLQNDSLIKSNPGIKLDFNAIAQGYTVDVMAEMLKKRNIMNFMVEVGGEVKAEGINPAGGKWKIGIDKPIEKGREINSIVELQDLALATSGNYRKFKVVDGKKIGHSIDPRTGVPTTNSLLSVSVTGKNCALTDGLATTFMVTGMDEALELLTKPEFEQYDALFIYSDTTGEIKEKFTPNFPLIEQ